MKVVIFCGGQGLRLREYSENVPKPMVPVGGRPIMWHLMKYYAHYGHTDFILCLGYQADVVKDYFLHYDEAINNDFVLRGNREVSLLNSDISKWSITFLDTGINANIGQRLMAVKEHLAGEEYFLANYADNLTDAHLPTLIDEVKSTGSIANLLAVRPSQSFHVLKTQPTGHVTELMTCQTTDMFVNGGFFVFRHDIFDYMRPGEELVLDPFNRLMAENKLICHKHEGFWAAMDTFKEKQTLDDLYTSGNAPWELWDGRIAKKNRKKSA
ncbi:MAG TPA: sugar phosphate nucleotidyltransferase [Tepidisphaeraceae bacterium]|jgi:glucose-1-phosphate cytidylyltransferase